MAFILAAGFPDPRPGAHPNQQLVIVQGWNGWSEQAYALGLRWHPELATKWVKGGGQFTCGELVDSPPEQPSLEKTAEEFLADLGDTDPELAKLFERIKASGSEDEKKLLAGELEQNIKHLLKLMEYLGNQQ